MEMIHFPAYNWISQPVALHATDANKHYLKVRFGILATLDEETVTAHTYIWRDFKSSEGYTRFMPSFTAAWHEIKPLHLIFMENLHPPLSLPGTGAVWFPTLRGLRLSNPQETLAPSMATH